MPTTRADHDRTDAELVRAVRAALRAAADPSRAPGMQAYMKSQLPYLGVPVPAVRAIVRGEARIRPPADSATLADTARTLWRGARFREERYAASALTDVRAARPLQTQQLVPLYAEMITTGAWWDHVDEVSHRIGGLLLSHPEQVRPIVLQWSRDDDRWLRRTSVICQLGAKARTDLNLLTSTVDANANDKDFFLRKAIGWALREYAWTDPEWVLRFVAEREAVLSPLSRREALKHLG